MDASPRVVVLDDDQDSRELSATVLRMRGFHVDEFELAEDALDAMFKKAPAVILMDIGLSGVIDGYETARRLLASDLTKSVRLVALTGYSASEVNEQGVPFDAVLRKPVDTDELVATVRQLTA